MPAIESAFDNFVDDCFIDGDPLCDISKEPPLELVASQLISELINEINDDLMAA